MYELYFENSDVSLVDREYNIRYKSIRHTVCKMVLGISRKNPKNPSPFLCAITAIRQKFNSPDFVESK